MTHDRANKTGKLRYGLVLEQGEDGWIVVRFPSFPGTITQGRTLEEALVNAREALELTIECMREDGEALPEPDLGVEMIEVNAA